MSMTIGKVLDAFPSTPRSLLKFLVIELVCCVLAFILAAVAVFFAISRGPSLPTDAAFFLVEHGFWFCVMLNLFALASALRHGPLPTRILVTAFVVVQSTLIAGLHFGDKHLGVIVVAGIASATVGVIALLWWRDKKTVS
jgi:hypothetical protein